MLRKTMTKQKKTSAVVGTLGGAACALLGAPLLTAAAGGFVLFVASDVVQAMRKKS